MENKEKKIKIYLHAYLDNNIGDDIMIKEFVRKYPNYIFYMRSLNSVVRKAFETEDNVRFISNTLYKKEIKNCDVYLKIGGSIFQYNSWIDNIKKFLNTIKLYGYKKKGLQLITLGSNLGPFYNNISKKLAKQEIKLYDLITVRDLKSYNIIKNDFKLDNVELYDDIVFEMLTNKKEVNKKSDEIVLGISAYRSIYDQNLNYDLYKNTARIVVKLLYQKNINIIKIFAFDSEKENDISAAYHIKRLIKKNTNTNIALMIIPYLGTNYNSFIKEISNVDYMIAVRFHSAILCDKFNIPYFPIAYSNKLANYIIDNSDDAKAIEVKNLNKLDLEDLSFDSFINRDKKIKTGHLDSFDKTLSERFNK